MKMYINGIGNYIPEKRIDNDYFLNVNGLSNEWILQRTGIKSRSKADENETNSSMAIEAVRNAIKNLPYDIKDVDLVIGATYSPEDTVFTMAHAVQREFDIRDAQVLLVTTACSSFLNALEIAQGYFSMGKASKALIVGSEHNSSYNKESDPKSGHLWGDGAVALFISNEKVTENDPVIEDVYTRGLGFIGKANTAVNLKPGNGGISMSDGKDVFINACKYMHEATNIILNRNNYTASDLTYFTGHQANKRIIDHVAAQLHIAEEKLLSNIESVGNTGSPSNIIVISQHWNVFKKGDLLISTVFGGGYSCGAYLIRF